jgi:hypothetical protein
MTRRAAVAAAICGTALPAQAVADERSFRYRIETVDSLFERVKRVRSEGKIDQPAYRSVLVILLDEQNAIAREASAYQFRDLTESNYWHRGRLKFPSTLQMELRRLDEARPPAL